MAQQTAVQKLLNNLYQIDIDVPDGIMEVFFEIEKEQITDAYIMGSYDMADKKFRPEQYYNETFKNK